MFNYGLEHEMCFINSNNTFADFTNTNFKDFQNIIDALPLYSEDYKMLRIGDAKIKLKRWYVEGFERYNAVGNVIDCVPKGIEIRTTVHSSLDNLMREYNESFEILVKEALSFGYRPICLSFNPIHSKFSLKTPLNRYEQKLRNSSPETLTAQIPMVTFGPDLSISSPFFDLEKLIDVGKKLTYYSPYIVPFSFSSPFLNNKISSFLSVRTYYRTGLRPSVLVFFKNKKNQISSKPSLTQESRVPKEHGRIEFKAFDTCKNTFLYEALFVLLKGIALDTKLKGRSLIPNRKAHQKSAKYGFLDKDISKQCLEILKAAKQALTNDKNKLDILFEALENKHSLAKEMISLIENPEDVQSELSKFVY